SVRRRQDPGDGARARRGARELELPSVDAPEPRDVARPLDGREAGMSAGERLLDVPKENLSGHTKKLRFLLEHLEDVLRRGPGTATLLDFGCGNGSAVSRFLMLPGIRYHGVDVHPASLAHARERWGSPTATFTSEVPEGVVFDVLVYADILEHLDDPGALLRDHAARLAAGGLLLGSVPNGYGWFE